MASQLIKQTNFDKVYKEISVLITEKKYNVRTVVNDAMISLYWGIGNRLSNEILNNEKPEYGKQLVDEISKRLTSEYGSGFGRSAVFKMIKFYQEYPDYEKVSTLSTQLTWSHFIELLYIDNELKRDFYATMCRNEN